MTEIAQWRLDIVAHGDRLTDAAMDVTADMNEARFLVHGVMTRALGGVAGPVSSRELDSDMGRALRKHADL